jgi:hypothetical protein
MEKDPASCVFLFVTCEIAAKAPASIAVKCKMLNSDKQHGLSAL